MTEHKSRYSAEETLEKLKGLAETWETEAKRCVATQEKWLERGEYDNAEKFETRGKAYGAMANELEHFISVAYV